AVAHAAPRRTHAETRAAVFPRAPRHSEHVLGFHQALRPHAGRVARALGAIAAILAATAGLDREQRAKLHLTGFPVFEVNVTRPLDEIEKRLLVNLLQLGELHAKRFAKVRIISMRRGRSKQFGHDWRDPPK